MAESTSGENAQGGKKNIIRFLGLSIFGLSQVRH